MPLPIHISNGIAESLEDIAAYFVAPKLTLVVRAPDLEDGDVVITTDNLDEAIKAIERLKASPAHPV